MQLSLELVVTWKHVAVFAMAMLMVLACSLTNVCARESLGTVIAFASAIAGAVAGHMGRNVPSRKKKAKKAAAAP